MVRLFIFLFIAHVTLGAIALIDSLSVERRAVRALPRAVWVALVVIVPLIGPVAWFLAGRPARTRQSGPTRRPGQGRRQAPLAPDDDPDFLRTLDGDRAAQDRQLFDRLERDLHRPEDGSRPRESGEQPEG